MAWYGGWVHPATNGKAVKGETGVQQDQCAVSERLPFLQWKANWKITGPPGEGEHEKWKSQ